MTKKIFAGIIIVSVVIMVVCTGLVMGVMYDYLGDKIDDELRDEALMIKAAIETESHEYLEKIKDDEELDSRITLIDTKGVVIFDSEADYEEMPSHLDREEVEKALTVGEGYAVRHSNTLSEDTRYYALKLENGSVLRVASNHYSQMALALDTIGVVVIIVAILLALGIIISAQITRGIIKPINDIDLDEPHISDDYEELLPLVKRINQQNKKIYIQMENLRKQQNEFKIIIQNMREGLLIIDMDKEVLTYNSGALRLLAAENQEKVEDVFQLNGSQGFRNAVEKALAGEHCRTMITVGETSCEIMADPVYEKNLVTGAVIIIIDVTEREKGEILRREFTSNVSHELKTPLTSIYGVSDMLEADLVKPEDVKTFVGTIKEESARLISLIDDIIKLSRLDEDNVMGESGPVDVMAVAEDVVRRLETKAAKEKVTLSLSGSNSKILGVESIVDEILYNLCENAIKYNKIDGKVDLSITQIGDECIVSVKDTGIGIPKADIKRVFERFYRVDKSHSKETGGTGLGLSIVKHAVTYLKGTIEIESVEKEGTKIILKFKAI